MMILLFFVSPTTRQWQDNAKYNAKRYRKEECFLPLKSTFSIPYKVPKINNDCIGYEGCYGGYGKCYTKTDEKIFVHFFLSPSSF